VAVSKCAPQRQHLHRFRFGMPQLQCSQCYSTRKAQCGKHGHSWPISDFGDGLGRLWGFRVASG
jgi:hypothetical protein